MKLQGKVIFITDADSGSGQAIARRMASEGASFILGSMSGGSELKQLLADLSAAGAAAFVSRINLCSKAEVTAMLKEAASVVGPIQVLVHNNNLVKHATVEHCDEELYHEVVNENAKSAFVCTQAAAELMKDRQSGSIVYVSSIHAEKPTGSAFLYSISKGAVKMLSKESALYLGRHGINVNTIEMGPVEGDNLLFGSSISSLYDDYQYKVPSAELGSHEDLANLVVFLSSDEARYINGADIRLDGGFLMHYMDFKMKKPSIDKEG